MILLLALLLPLRLAIALPDPGCPDLFMSELNQILDRTAVLQATIENPVVMLHFRKIQLAQAVKKVQLTASEAREALQSFWLSPVNQLLLANEMGMEMSQPGRRKMLDNAALWSILEHYFFNIASQKREPSETEDRILRQTHSTFEILTQSPLLAVKAETDRIRAEIYQLGLDQEYYAVEFAALEHLFLHAENNARILSGRDFLSKAEFRRRSPLLRRFDYIYRPYRSEEDDRQNYKAASLSKTSLPFQYFTSDDWRMLIHDAEALGHFKTAQDLRSQYASDWGPVSILAGE